MTKVIVLRLADRYTRSMTSEALHPVLASVLEADPDEKVTWFKG